MRETQIPNRGSASAVEIINKSISDIFIVGALLILLALKCRVVFMLIYRKAGIFPPLAATMQTNRPDHVVTFTWGRIYLD